MVISYLFKQIKKQQQNRPVSGKSLRKRMRKFILVCLSKIGKMSFPILYPCLNKKRHASPLKNQNQINRLEERSLVLSFLWFWPRKLHREVAMLRTFLPGPWGAWCWPSLLFKGLESGQATSVWPARIVRCLDSQVQVKTGRSSFHRRKFPGGSAFPSIPRFQDLT